MNDRPTSVRPLLSRLRLAALLFACAAPLSALAAPLTDAQAMDLLKKEEERSNAKGDMRIITDVQVEHAGSPGCFWPRSSSPAPRP
jgi:hypothetical protein